MTDDNVKIRLTCIEETERLFYIWLSAIDATHAFLSPEDKSFFAAMVRDDYLPNGAFWVAVDGQDIPLAFMGLEGDKVDSLFVHADRRGSGLGSALLAHARTLRDSLSVDVNEQNKAAVRFYERRGFRVERRSPLDGSGRPYPLLHMVSG